MPCGDQRSWATTEPQRWYQRAAPRSCGEHRRAEPFQQSTKNEATAVKPEGSQPPPLAGIGWSSSGVPHKEGAAFGLGRPQSIGTASVNPEGPQS